ncbi:MAG: hypothetical protein ACYC2H_08195 [Thermoplasmatota archaeon]
MPEKPVGKVEHYYPKVQAAAVRLTKKVKLGDKVHIVGHGDDFKEEVTSLQLDHEPIQEGQPGQAVGLWVKERVHKGDDVLLMESGPAKAKRAAAKPRKAPKKAKKAKSAKAKPKRAAGKPKSAKRAKRAKPARKAKKAARKGARKSAKKRR